MTLASSYNANTIRSVNQQCARSYVTQPMSPPNMARDLRILPSFLALGLRTSTMVQSSFKACSGLCLAGECKWCRRLERRSTHMILMWFRGIQWCQWIRMEIDRNHPDISTCNAQLPVPHTTLHNIYFLHVSSEPIHPRWSPSYMGFIFPDTHSIVAIAMKV